MGRRYFGFGVFGHPVAPCLLGESNCHKLINSRVPAVESQFGAISALNEVSTWTVSLEQQKLSRKPSNLNRGSQCPVLCLMTFADAPTSKQWTYVHSKKCTKSALSCKAKQSGKRLWLSMLLNPKPRQHVGHSFSPAEPFRFILASNYRRN